jgi:hypothetical protein
MRNRSLTSAAWALLLLGGAAAADDHAPRACITLEDFSGTRDGEFPAAWEAKPAVVKSIYTVRSEGGVRFLRATARGTGQHTGKRVEWDLRTHPLVCWKWRARVFPTGANERDGKNDSVLSVYVGFKRKWSVIKYLWSERLPVGTEFEKGVFGRVKERVLTSGVPADKDKFVEVCADAAGDFMRRFGEKDAGTADGIGVLTDSDQTGSYAEGDYADFRACTR